MTGYRWMWVTWLIAFLALEGTALVRQRVKDTLSGFAWDICRVTPGNTLAHWTAIHFFVVIFMFWLLLHIGWGFWR